MSDIHALIRDILGKLQMLADGGTQDLNPDKRFNKHAESGPPAGVSLRPSDQPPAKEHASLFEWYRWQFEHHAADPKKLRVLWMLACDDYEDFRFKADHRIELRKGELLDNDPRDGGAAERAQAERVVDWYEGRPALYVAMLEGQPEAWVKKARRQLGRNPDDGRARPEFLELPEDDRRRKVAYLASHMGKKKAADKLGVDPGTVRKYWPESAELDTVAA